MLLRMFIFWSNYNHSTVWHLKISIKSSWNRSSYLQGSRCHLWEGYWNVIDGAQLHILYQILCWPNMPICLLPENIKPRPDWHGSLIKTPSPFSAKVYVWEKRGLKWNFSLIIWKGESKFYIFSSTVKKGGGGLNFMGFFPGALKKGGGGEGLYHGAYPSPSHKEYPLPHDLNFWMNEVAGV